MEYVETCGMQRFLGFGGCFGPPKKQEVDGDASTPVDNGYFDIFWGMNIHLPPVLVFTLVCPEPLNWACLTN